MNYILQEGSYEWSESLQGVILGSFFYGYIVSQIPGGILAEKFGGKKLYGYGVLVTAILTLISPVVIDNVGVHAFIVLRVMMGVGEV